MSPLTGAPDVGDVMATVGESMSRSTEWVCPYGNGSTAGTLFPLTGI